MYYAVGLKKLTFEDEITVENGTERAVLSDPPV